MNRTLYSTILISLGFVAGCAKHVDNTPKQCYETVDIVAEKGTRVKCLPGAEASVVDGHIVICKCLKATPSATAPVAPEAAPEAVVEPHAEPEPMPEPEPEHHVE